uniref:Uncharacterized protein n=1 Tax=Cannabis sativa TaxID=3483 RepID=A0A803QGK6_CANSA
MENFERPAKDAKLEVVQKLTSKYLALERRVEREKYEQEKAKREKDKKEKRNSPSDKYARTTRDVSVAAEKDLKVYLVVANVKLEEVEDNVELKQ